MSSSPAFVKELRKAYKDGRDEGRREAVPLLRRASRALVIASLDQHTEESAAESFDTSTAIDKWVAGLNASESPLLLPGECPTCGHVTIKDTALYEALSADRDLISPTSDQGENRK